MSKLLMSYQNPTGFKLEILLDQIIDELNDKNELLKSKPKCPVLDQAITINNKTIAYLMLSKSSQEDVMRCFEQLGPDQGPQSPRIK